MTCTWSVGIEYPLLREHPEHKKQEGDGQCLSNDRTRYLDRTRVKSEVKRRECKEQNADLAQGLRNSELANVSAFMRSLLGHDPSI